MQMTEDWLWFRLHPERNYRSRPATRDELSFVASELDAMPSTDFAYAIVRRIRGAPPSLQTIIMSFPFLPELTEDQCAEAWRQGDAIMGARIERGEDTRQ